MQKPKLFDETRTTRFERIMTGPHKAVIMQVEDASAPKFSPRLIVVVSLGAVAIILLLIFMIRFRKR